MALTDPPHIITGILSWLYALTRGGFYAACPGRNAVWLAQAGQKSMFENQLRPGSWFEGLKTSKWPEVFSYEMKPEMVEHIKIRVLRC